MNHGVNVPKKNMHFYKYIIALLVIVRMARLKASYTIKKWNKLIHPLIQSFSWIFILILNFSVHKDLIYSNCAEAHQVVYFWLENRGNDRCINYQSELKKKQRQTCLVYHSYYLSRDSATRGVRTTFMAPFTSTIAVVLVCVNGCSRVQSSVVVSSSVFSVALLSNGVYGVLF